MSSEYLRNIRFMIKSLNYNLDIMDSIRKLKDIAMNSDNVFIKNEQIDEILKICITNMPQIFKDLKDKTINSDYMGGYYTSWIKVQGRGRKRKERVLSKVTDDNLKTIHYIMNSFKLNTSDKVYSYIPGKGSADCAVLFTGLHEIIGFDIKDFFFSVTRPMVEKMFLKHITKSSFTVAHDDLKYRLSNKEVAYLLSVLATSSDPRKTDDRNQDTAVLIQGTKCAGGISNSILFGLDVILNDYCNNNNLIYARYSDNFYIGSDKDIPETVIDFVTSAISGFDPGGPPFVIHKDKTRRMKYSTHQRVLGIVVNEHTNISKQVEKLFRAKLTNLSRNINRKAELIDKAIDNEINNPDFDFSNIHKKITELKGMVSYIKAVNVNKYNKYKHLIGRIEFKIKVLKHSLGKLNSYNDQLTTINIGSRPAKSPLMLLRRCDVISSHELDIKIPDGKYLIGEIYPNHTFINDYNDEIISIWKLGRDSKYYRIQTQFETDESDYKVINSRGIESIPFEDDIAFTSPEINIKSDSNQIVISDMNVANLRDAMEIIWLNRNNNNNLLFAEEYYRQQHITRG